MRAIEMGVLHRFYLLLFSSDHRDQARQIQFLKVENEILRAHTSGRIVVTPSERLRLLRYAKPLGKAMRQLVSIVSPGTVLRWIREEREDRGRTRRPVKIGRRRTPEQIRRLVVKLAHENDWGYTRIIGELKKLGIKPPSKNTVKRILQSKGLDPGPKRGRDSWDDFLKRHAHSLWQCDFLSRRVMTITGLRDAFVLAFVHVKTRQVILSPSSFHPNDRWVTVQACRFVEQARARGLKVRIVQTDRDQKFSVGFVQELKRHRVKPFRSSFRAPNMNAYAERFIQTLGQECLDRFLIFGLSHFDHLNSEFLVHYHEDRPHQSLNNEPITQPGQNVVVYDAPISLRDIHCRSRLGGLLKSYRRQAA